MTSVPSRTRSVQRGQPGQRRPALQEVVPGPPDLRDLPEVVHDVDRVEAGLLGRRRRSPAAAGPSPAAPPGNAERCSPNRSPTGRSRCRATAASAAAKAAGTTRTGSGVSTWSKPSPGSASRTAGQARSCAAERVGRHRVRPAPGCGPGTTAAGVSKPTATQAIRCARASARQRARRAASSPMVSMTVVSPRATRRVTISSSRAKASVLAAMSSSPAPTTARSRSLDTTASGGKCAAAQLDFPDPVGPTSTRQGEGNRGHGRRPPRQAHGRTRSGRKPSWAVGSGVRGVGPGVRGARAGGCRGRVAIPAVGQPLLHVLGDLVLLAPLPDPDQHQHRDAVGDAQHQQHHPEPADEALHRLVRAEVDPQR